MSTFLEHKRALRTKIVGQRQCQGDGSFKYVTGTMNPKNFYDSKFRLIFKWLLKAVQSNLEQTFLG